MWHEFGWFETGYIIYILLRGRSYSHIEVHDGLDLAFVDILVDGVLYGDVVILGTVHGLVVETWMVKLVMGNRRDMRGSSGKARSITRRRGSGIK